VPLNDPEDQVLYFSNVPDFLNSIQSVQIQRGVGSSTFGTASYAGSMNFQSVPLATTPRGGDLQLTGGSFNTPPAYPTTDSPAMRESASCTPTAIANTPETIHSPRL
jgi:iron complex outermembrane receptor protein